MEKKPVTAGIHLRINHESLIYHTARVFIKIYLSNDLIVTETQNRTKET